jgi:capsular polysaccharide biosynthesis protein
MGHNADLTMRESAPGAFTRRILRRLSHRLGRILLLWLTISSFLTYLIWTFVPPTYQAFSLLHFESAHPFLYDPSAEHLVDLRGMDRHLQTQVNLILSDKVLSQAVADSSVSNVPMIKRSEDPKADLRKKLGVEIVQDADLIRISLESANAEEAAAIVEAVVDSYMSRNQAHTQSANANLKKSLQNEYTKLTEQINEAKGRLRALTQTGNVDLAPQAPPEVSASNPANGPARPTVSELTEGQYETLVSEMLKADLALLDAETELGVRKAMDPADKRVNKLTLNVAVLRRQKESRAAFLSNLHVAKKTTNTAKFDHAYANFDLQSLESAREAVRRYIQQVEFRSSSDQYHVALVDPAAVPRIPTHNKRLKYLAIAPVVVVLALLVVFALRPVEGETNATAGRINDAELPGS